MLASGIKGIRIQLRKGSDRFSTIFMRRRLACSACLQRGAAPQFYWKNQRQLGSIQDRYRCLHL